MPSSVYSRPTVINTGALEKSIRAASEAQAKAIEEQLRLTTSTWEGSKPAFEVVAEPRGFLIGPVDNGGQGFLKWLWLEQGTSIRYATMSDGFRPKTSPRVVQAVVGAGGAQYVNVRRPRPGIEAREWRQTIVEEHNQRGLADNTLPGRVFNVFRNFFRRR